MLHLQLDPRSAVPAYRQLMDQVRYYVASGALAPGDRLPSIRQLARYLGINPTTVVKAFGELEHEGVIALEHGKGAFVTEGSRKLSTREVATALRGSARQLAVEAVQMGAPASLVLRIVEEELNAMTAKRKPR